MQLTHAPRRDGWSPAVGAPVTAAPDGEPIPTWTNFVTRERWGSRPDSIPENRKQKPIWITIHHAGDNRRWRSGTDPADLLRKLQSWGKREKGWPDLPYHFIISPDGRIFQGRSVRYEPDSNTRYSLKGNIGVELLGNFNLERPTPEQLLSAAYLTAWLSRQYGIGMTSIRTHRDAAPGETDCPGKDFYRYFLNGRFQLWVQGALSSQRPVIDPGPPLPDGPYERIVP